MYVFLIVLIAAGAVSADLSGVLSALELLQHRIESDLKFAEVHALLDLDNFVQDTQKGIAAMIKDPVRGTKEFTLNLMKDLKQSGDWAKQDFRSIKSHLQEAIQNIKRELKTIEQPVARTTD